MKKSFLIIMFITISINIVSLRNWQIYTNTTHIYDIIEIDNKIYQATWGGLEVYDIENDSFVKTYTIFDGLEDQNIKTISYLESSHTTLLGTSKAGINRIRDDVFQTPINETIGLPDNKVNIIVNCDALIYVATDEGLTVFKDVPDFPYPLPINHYATHNGLASTNITSLALAQNGYLFIGTDQGLNYVHTSEMFNITAWHLVNTNNSSLPDNRITSLSINDNLLAIGTQDGLVRTKIDDNIGLLRYLDLFTEWEVFTEDSHPLASRRIFSVYVDNKFQVWTSYGVWNNNNLLIEQTEDIVITRISSNNVFTHWQNHNNGLITDQIKGFREINDVIFIYTWGEGLFFFENSIWKNRKSDTMTANNITDISVDLNGKIWVCNGFVGGDIQRRGNPGISGFDGNSWTTFRAATSPLVHDRIFRITTDARNRKWFGSWNHGISVFDENKDTWYHYNRGNGLPANEIGALTTDDENNIWISAYSGGMVVVELDAIENTGTIPTIASFHLYSPNIPYSDVINIFPASDMTFFGSFYSGIRYWDATGFPQTHQTGDDWKKPPFPQLSDGYIYVYGIDSRETHWGEEVWIASENGLFMYDTYNSRWYRYGTGIKRHVWLNNDWERDKLYFVDEERLYGAAPTFPTAILIDPFDRVWIGTESNGLTIYDINTDRFRVYNTNNSPLVSNNITALAYEPYSGNLYIGTDNGLNSVEIGKILKADDPPLATTVVYPNPFYPDKGQVVTITNKVADEHTIMPQGDNKCNIYNIKGELIITLEENRYFEFSWDGINSEGKKCGNGIYYYVVSASDGQTERGTIVLIR